MTETTVNNVEKNVGHSEPFGTGLTRSNTRKIPSLISNRKNSCNAVKYFSIASQLTRLLNKRVIDLRSCMASLITTNAQIVTIECILYSGMHSKTVT